MGEFEALRRAVLLRALREGVHGDTRPVEELVPREGEQVRDVSAQAVARKAEAELDQRIKGFVLAAAVLAQPAQPALPEASSVLTERGLRESIVALFDATLSAHRLSLLKPLVVNGSRTLREAIGGFIWAGKRLAFQAARRYFTWTLNKLEMASRNQLAPGGLVHEMVQPLSAALGLQAPWVEPENQSILCTPAEIDKEDAVQQPLLGLRDAFSATDGTVSVSIDLAQHISQHWASPRRSLFVFPPQCKSISITLGMDGAGLTKRGAETTLVVWTYNDARFMRSTLSNTHMAVVGNFSDGNYESCKAHLHQFRQDLQAPHNATPSRDAVHTSARAAADERRALTQVITDPAFTLEHPRLGHLTVKVYGAFDGKACCTIGGNTGPKSQYPVWSTTAPGTRLTNPVPAAPHLPHLATTASALPALVCPCAPTSRPCASLSRVACVCACSGTTRPTTSRPTSSPWCRSCATCTA